ncbi:MULTISPECIES: helix-turn-helix domain-containing protein [Hungatella]|uniref:Stage 0 sporulation protein A homolog n=1 Tax=Hungatella hathewayi TaxID=154046 RepID=A0AAW9WM13_9FIRM|nr:MULTISPECIES: helix-turn-helix domain-containing protein [Hungatella]MCQ4830845.1 response regulator [Hungatella sp. SL.1.14]MUB65484.1 response regulator [Hungatella hathewayi]
MRFAVADDVLLARKAVEKLILEWDRDSTVCCSCDNGDEVLKVLEDQKVDVLVTDIRMPGLNGIALSEVVRQRFPSVDVVLVSGYATFDYARAALHNGVRDYLLKPLKREDLFHTLDAIKKARAEEKRQEDLLREVQKRAGSFLLLRYLSGEERPEDVLPREMTGLKNGCFFAAQIMVKGVKFEELSIRLRDLSFSRDLIFEDILHSGAGVIVSCGEERAVAVYDKKIRALGTLAEQERKEGHPAAVGVSMLLTGPDSIREAYSQARRACCLRLQDPERGLYRFDNDRGKELLSKEDLHLIRNHLNAKRVKEAKEFCLKKMIQPDMTTVLQLEQSYQALLGICFTMDMEAIYRPLWDFDDMNGLLDYICSMACCSGETDRTVNEGDIIDEIQAFLEDNYYCEISLNELAATKYFMNPNYLSRLFKARTGMGFSKYLLGLRMKKAEELLENGDMNINEVALMVGYTSPSYFIQNFKKYFGRTPGTQRNKPELR